MATGLRYAGNDIIDGSAKPKAPTGRIKRNMRVSQLQEKPREAIVRVMIGRKTAKSFYGKAIQAAAKLNGIFLRDNEDNDVFPIGYVIHRASQGLEIKINRSQPIKSLTLLPIRSGDLAPGDVIYLYFSVKRGVRLISLNVGSNQVKALNSMQIPK